MNLPSFTIRNLLEAGVHFGHHPRRWNPKMEEYIFGVRNGVHIINLERTVPLLYKALEVAHEVGKAGGRILFVGTKRQASSVIEETAKQCNQHFVNHRWLGGMMTNWKTVSNSIARLEGYEQRLSEETEGLTKKEILQLTRHKDKLDRAIGGIREMGGRPDLVVVVDTNKESLAIKEANKLGVPVIGILDTNSDPDGVDFPIPGNDDATRAIELYCKLIAGAILGGVEAHLQAEGIDLGASADLPAEMENVDKLSAKPAKKAPAKKTNSKPAEKADKEATAEAKA